MLKKFTLSIFIFSFALFAQANAQTEAATEKQTAVKELVGLINADNRAEEIFNLLSIQMDSLRETTIESILEERSDLTPDEKKITPADAFGRAKRSDQTIPGQTYAKAQL